MRPMRTAMVLLVLLPAVPVVIAQDAASQANAFRPYELVGEWQFTNTNGVRYRGDIKVAIASADPNGVMRGRVSYDGRQTNDKCTTRPVVTDAPVDAEVVRSDNGYRVTFQLTCLSGESPRPFQWVLGCESGVCTQTTVVPNGRGLITLRENR